MHETFAGETVWDGTVEVFALHGYAWAGVAYAWAHETDTGGRCYVAVLQLPPVKNAADAVRAGDSRRAQEVTGGMNATTL